MNKKILISLFVTTLMLCSEESASFAQSISVSSFNGDDGLKNVIEKESQDPNLSITLTSDITSESVINVIDKYVSIDGGKLIASDESKDHRTFLVNSNSALSLISTDVSGFEITYNNEVRDDLSGGVIYSEGDLTITGSRFLSNIASDENLPITKIVTGGAIYVAEGNATINGASYFSNNSARRGVRLPPKTFLRPPLQSQIPISSKILR